MSIEVSLTILAICSLVITTFLVVLIAVLLIATFKLNIVINKLSDHTEKALTNGNEIAEKLKNDIEAVQPFFHSIAKVGSMMSDFTDRFSHQIKEKPLKKISFTSMKTKEGKVLDLLEFLGLGILMWQNLNKGVDDE